MTSFLTHQIYSNITTTTKVKSLEFISNGFHLIGGLRMKLMYERISNLCVKFQVTFHFQLNHPNFKISHLIKISSSSISLWQSGQFIYSKFYKHLFFLWCLNNYSISFREASCVSYRFWLAIVFSTYTSRGGLFGINLNLIRIFYSEVIFSTIKPFYMVNLIYYEGFTFRIREAIFEPKNSSSFY